MAKAAKRAEYHPPPALHACLLSLRSDAAAELEGAHHDACASWWAPSGWWDADADLGGAVPSVAAPPADGSFTPPGSAATSPAQGSAATSPNTSPGGRRLSLERPTTPPGSRRLSEGPGTPPADGARDGARNGARDGAARAPLTAQFGGSIVLDHPPTAKGAVAGAELWGTDALAPLVALLGQARAPCSPPHCFLAPRPLTRFVAYTPHPPLAPPPHPLVTSPPSSHPS